MSLQNRKLDIMLDFTVWFFFHLIICTSFLLWANPPGKIAVRICRYLTILAISNEWLVVSAFSYDIIILIMHQGKKNDKNKPFIFVVDISSILSLTWLWSSFEIIRFTNTVEIFSYSSKHYWIFSTKSKYPMYDKKPW